MNNKGYSIPEMLVVIGILGIVTLGILLATSNSFKDNSAELYAEKTKLIVHQAEIYAKTLNNLESEGHIIVTLSDVVKAGYYVADDDEGNVIDPRNTKSTLNGLKIKLLYNDGNIKASIIEED